MRDVLSDNTKFDFRSRERSTRRAKGVDSRVLIQLRVRSHTPRCYSRHAAVTLLTFYGPLRGHPSCRWANPPLMCFAGHLLPKEERSRRTSGYRSDKALAELRGARQTPMRFLTFCSFVAAAVFLPTEVGRGSALGFNRANASVSHDTNIRPKNS